MKGKLNIPQKTVLLWDDMHPYNAVHVAGIPRTLDLARLKDAVDRHLQGKGLTGLVIDRKRKRYHFNGGRSDVDIKFAEGNEDALSRLSREVQEQINTPFKFDAPIVPFRFFVIKEEKSFCLGLVYYHLISGGDSIIRLLKGIVKYYMEGDDTYLKTHVNLYQKGRIIRSLADPKFLSGWLMNLPAHIAEVKSFCRPRYKDLNDHKNGAAFFSVNAANFRPLLKTAKEWAVTVNDIFIAILLKSLAPLSSNSRFKERRNRISIVSSVNIRRALSVKDSEGFGMFLGTFNVSHLMREEIQIRELAGDVHRQTERLKTKKLYLGAIMEQGFALLLSSLNSGDRRNRIYTRNYPLWGGISNINLNTFWDPDDRARGNYFRAVSTGPATPLVLSLTTSGDVLNAGVTFRKTVFSETAIEKIISDFTNYISKLNLEKR